MIIKKYFPENPICEVTFTYSSGTVPETVHIVGDFNNWDQESTALTKLLDGRFRGTLELHIDCEYQFQYLVNGDEWQNDEGADKYIPNAFSGYNSVVVT